MNYRLNQLSAVLLAIMATGMLQLCGCSNEPSKTEATPAAASGAAPPAAAPGPGAPPAGAVAGGGVGERINK